MRPEGWRGKGGKLFSQHGSNRCRYRRGVDCVPAGGRTWQWQHTEFCPTLEVIPGSPLYVPQRLDRRAATGGFHTPPHTHTDTQTDSVCVCVCVCVSPNAEVCTESQRPTDLLTARNVARCVFYKQHFFFNNAFSVLAGTMQTCQGYRFLPHPSHLVKHTLSLSAADCTHVEPDLVCVGCMTWIALPSSKVIWLRPVFEPPTVLFSIYRRSIYREQAQQKSPVLWAFL